MWWVFKEAILAKHNLLGRKILLEDKCEQCGVESETAIHALWECVMLDEIWEVVLGFEDQRQYTISNTRDLNNVLHKKRKNLELMAMVMWTIWHWWNQLRVSSNFFPKAQVLQQATQALATFQQSQQSHINNAVITRPHRFQWSPPANCAKLNFDGAIFPELGKAGLSVVVHDSHGNAIASLSEQAPLPFSPVIVEAMATARAITFTQELGIKKFMLEGNSEAVINTLQSTEVSLTTFGHLLESAKSTLTTSKCIAFTHIRRIDNRVAHNLTKHARHVRGLSVWVEDIPPHFYDVRFADPC